MQVEEKRACPQCSAENPPESRFCWRCYQPFGATGAAPAPPVQGRPGMASRSAEPAMPHASQYAGRVGMPQAPVQVAAPPAPVKSSSSTIARVAIAVVAAAAGYFLVGKVLGGTSYEVPDSIAGVSKMTGAVADDFEAEMSSLGDEYGVTVDSGIYGEGEIPSLALIVMSGKAIESTDELFNAFMDGMASSGVEVGRGDERTGEIDGDEFRCVPISGSGVQASVCMWRGADQMGMFLDLTNGVDDVQPTLREAHRAVNG